MVCNIRCALLVFCVIQIVAITEKQVFDFLCFLWTPIILNVLHMLLTVIVLVGICRYIYRILVIYSVWCIIWTGWNIFVLCFFYEVGVLNRNLPIMNLGCNNFVWLPGKLLGCSEFFDNSANLTTHHSSSAGHSIDSTVETELMLHLYTSSLMEETKTNLINEAVSLMEPSISTLPISSTYSDNQSEIELLNSPITAPNLLSSTASNVTNADDYKGGVYNADDGHRYNHSIVLFQSALGGDDTSLPTVPVSYRNLQAFHALIQCSLAIFCFILTCILAHIYSEEEDSSCLEFDFISGSLLPQNEKNSTQRYQLKALYVSTSSPR